MKTATRPILRYHGGKWLLAPWVIRHFPKHRIYLEAYAGAGSVLFRKRPAYSEVLNELDGEIVNVFRVLRDPLQSEQLRELLTLTAYARSEWKLAYEPTADPVEAARRTVVRSFQGFGSDSTRALRTTGFRSNSNRSGTTAAVDWSRYPAQIAAFTSRLAGVLIEQRPALEVLREHDTRATLHYVDPPYLLSTRSAHRKTYNHELTETDHHELAEVLRGLRGMVVISHYDCELYRGLYRGWLKRSKRVTVFRASPRVESLWLNPACSRALGRESTPLFGRRKGGGL